MKHFLVLILLFSVSAFADAKKEEKTSNYKLATFAGGCFWCLQPPFDKLKGQGVIETRVGYSGGNEKNPTYEQVGMGQTGHAESIQVTYDPTKVTYEKLLDVYWNNIDPTDADGQFVDRGKEYRPVIFYHDEEQKKIATESKKKLINSKEYSKPIVVPIEAYKFFSSAEDYHQEYYKKNPVRYELYKAGSGRKKH